MAGGSNLYGYGNGDAINNSDPFGLCPWCWVIAVAVVHYARDLFNDSSKCDEQVEQQNTARCRERASPERKVFHTQGEGNENNRLFESADGHHEVVTKDGKVVTDDRNRGTYNYCPTGNALQTASHVLCDVVPYMILGNSPADALNIVARIRAGAKGVPRK